VGQSGNHDLNTVKSLVIAPGDAWKSAPAQQPVLLLVELLVGQRSGVPASLLSTSVISRICDAAPMDRSSGLVSGSAITAGTPVLQVTSEAPPVGAAYHHHDDSNTAFSCAFASRNRTLLCSAHCCDSPPPCEDAGPDVLALDCISIRLEFTGAGS
jgi:hypothetical protein